MEKNVMEGVFEDELFDTKTVGQLLFDTYTPKILKTLNNIFSLVNKPRIQEIFGFFMGVSHSNDYNTVSPNYS